MDKIINKETGISWLDAKPHFGRLLAKEFECVVNIDADSIVLGRLTEIFTKDYDVGSVTNLNDYENRHLENVTDEMYLQAGLVASRRPEFWDKWCAINETSWQYQCAENDTLNLLVYNVLVKDGWKLKIFDKDKDYYGCKLLNREKECTSDQLGVYCRGEQVKLYHAAKGPQNMPKLSEEKLLSYGFSPEVVRFMNFVGKYGKSAIYEAI